MFFNNLSLVLWRTGQKKRDGRDIIPIIDPIIKKSVYILPWPHEPVWYKYIWPWRSYEVMGGHQRSLELNRAHALRTMYWKLLREKIRFLCYLPELKHITISWKIEKNYNNDNFRDAGPLKDHVLKGCVRKFLFLYYLPELKHITISWKI